MTQVLITVALCTHNRVERLKTTLRAMRTLRRPNAEWELLIIDNASTDGTAAYLAQAEWRPEPVPVRTVREPRLGIAHARNRAVADARGEYVLFIDDDETPHEEWLRQHETAIVQHRPDAAGGPIEVRLTGGERPKWLQPELMGFLGQLDHGPQGRLLTDETTPIFTGNAAFRRAVFDRLGAFDKSLGRRGAANYGGEDIELYERLIRAGCKVLWVPEALIYHRIEAPKLRRGYFLDLHFRSGRTEGARRRGQRSRLPPRYLYPQLLRAAGKAIGVRIQAGAAASLRSEMNVAYFLGFLAGWSLDRS
jgi:glycosyltransferase involved in cell wall biosynthesis